MNIAETINLDTIVGMDNDGSAGIFDDGRTLEMHAGLQFGAVVDRRVVNTFQGVINLTGALGG